jgi:PleD family two-component response regulator
LGGLLALDETIEWADHALLMAKASGRNQVCVWDDAQQGQHPLK